MRNIVLLRPVNTMIEFKQIIGRGTRLFDGKDYFTIYDFVKATSTSTIPKGTANRSSRSRGESRVRGPKVTLNPSRPGRTSRSRSS